MGATYSLRQRADGWVISVGDKEILKCSRRTTAINVIRQAAGHLSLPEDGFVSSAQSCSDELALTVAHPAT